MAGGDDAFRDAGYAYPKNLVEINGLPLIQRVTQQVQPLLKKGARLFVINRREENRQYHTASALKLLAPQVTIIELAQPTAGAACTALLAMEHISNDEPILICNGDIILETPIASMIDEFRRKKLDGGIVVFEAVHPRWSYVRCNAEGYVIETAEKRPISTLATVGLYYFRQGNDFVQAAMEMIRKGDHVENRFYICPSYNQMILKQAKIGVAKVAKDAYFSLATPQGVQSYEAHLKNRVQEVV